MADVGIWFQGNGAKSDYNWLKRGVSTNVPIEIVVNGEPRTETDGGDIPKSAQWPETTVLVPTGSTRTIEFVADDRILSWDNSRLELRGDR